MLQRLWEAIEEDFSNRYKEYEIEDLKERELSATFMSVTDSILQL